MYIDKGLDLITDGKSADEFVNVSMKREDTRNHKPSFIKPSVKLEEKYEHIINDVHNSSMKVKEMDNKVEIESHGGEIANDRISKRLVEEKQAERKLTMFQSQQISNVHQMASALLSVATLRLPSSSKTCSGLSATRKPGRRFNESSSQSLPREKSYIFPENCCYFGDSMCRIM